MVRNVDWPQALMFGCDGVVAETDELHLEAFNRAFQREGLPVEWGPDEYTQLLRIGTARGRLDWYMNAIFRDVAAGGEDPDADADLDLRLNALADAVFESYVTAFTEDVLAGAEVSARPGVIRLMREALDCDTHVCVVSGSDGRTVQAVLRAALGDELLGRVHVYASDTIARGKPHPEGHCRAATDLELDNQWCVGIEDSRSGLLAVRAAGMRCMVVPSAFTAEDDFDIADAVCDSIGDEGAEEFTIHDLTTPGTFWINPPMPMDAEGNWIPDGPAGDGVFRKRMAKSTFAIEYTGPDRAEASEADSDGLSAAERAILADLDLT